MYLYHFLESLVKISFLSYVICSKFKQAKNYKEDLIG